MKTKGAAKQINELSCPEPEKIERLTKNENRKTMDGANNAIEDGTFGCSNFILFPQAG